MYTQKNFHRNFAITLMALASQSVFAGGYQLNAQSAKGLGRAFAGDAVIADDASAMARNAASMALFDRDSLSFGVTLIDTDISVKSGTYHPLVGPDQDTYYDQAGDLSYAPNIYFIHPINDKWAVGFDAFTNFGTKTEFDDSFVGTEYGGLTDVKSVNLGASVSYRVNPHWSIGAGIDVIYGKGEIKRNFETPQILGGDTLSMLHVDTDGWAVGANVGTVLELDENNRFGLSYRFSPKLEADGDVSVAGQPSESDTLKLPIPDLVEFSGFHKLNRSFALHYSVQYVSWNEFDTLDTENLGAIKKYDWVDSWHYALGGTYYLNDDWTLRAGYMYDESAQGNYGSVSVPDSARNWFSTGFTYNISPDSDVDFGFTYLMGEDNDITESYSVPGIGGTSMDAKTRANAYIFAFQYSHQF